MPRITCQLSPVEREAGTPRHRPRGRRLIPSSSLLPRVKTVQGAETAARTRHLAARERAFRHAKDNRRRGRNVCCAAALAIVVLVPGHLRSQAPGPDAQETRSHMLLPENDVARTAERVVQYLQLAECAEGAAANARRRPLDHRNRCRRPRLNDGP